MTPIPENMRQWIVIMENIFPGEIILIDCKPFGGNEVQMFFKFSYCGISFTETFLNCCPQDHMEQTLRKVLEKFMEPLIKFHALK